MSDIIYAALNCQFCHYDARFGQEYEMKTHPIFTVVLGCILGVTALAILIWWRVKDENKGKGR